MPTPTRPGYARSRRRALKTSMSPGCTRLPAVGPGRCAASAGASSAHPLPGHAPLDSRPSSYVTSERLRRARALRSGGEPEADIQEGAMAEHSEFRKQLEAAVNARHSRLNPFTVKWVKGELTRAQLGAWAAQHYQYVSQFPRWCATVYGECPDPDARDFLLENVIEEERGTNHVDLLLR